MTKPAMCLNWFCFCAYYKGWSGYSTISDYSRSSANVMGDKSSALVKEDKCENCTRSPMDGNHEKTVAMVSQAEVWQEEKKFTVKYVLFFLFY